MKNSFKFVFLICAAAITLQAQTPPTSGQQPDDEVLRISTSLVAVPVTVKTRQGTYIPNLRREDFRIYEDGIEQEVSNFETIDAPFTVILMLDVSDSTRIKLREIQNAACAFLNQLRPSDRALIVSFDRQLSVLSSATGDRKVLADAINHVQTGGGTAIYDAIEVTISSQLKQIPGRKAVVVLTDGVDTASLHATYESTLRLATEQYALIYAIQYDTPSDVKARQPNDQFGLVTYTTPSGEPLNKAYERGTRYLRSIAGISGGSFHYSDTVKNLEKSFARIAEELRQQYSLSYYPKTPNSKSGKRRLKIIVSVPQAIVHARDSYAYKSN
ncbi:MAG TPA: VWA domain-containing protein [Pyrinomonadaceae bacterium]|nr:VWA domain-containing protein [Pyrinomonadaceae bacterium]